MNERKPAQYRREVADKLRLLLKEKRAEVSSLEAKWIRANRKANEVAEKERLESNG